MKAIKKRRPHLSRRKKAKNNNSKKNLCSSILQVSWMTKIGMALPKLSE
jgi:hypothetical protein